MALATPYLESEVAMGGLVALSEKGVLRATQRMNDIAPTNHGEGRFGDDAICTSTRTSRPVGFFVARSERCSN